MKCNPTAIVNSRKCWGDCTIEGIELRAPIEEGHVSCAIVHLVNASHRLGRSLTFDPDTERVVNDEEANGIPYGADRGYRGPFVIPKDV